MLFPPVSNNVVLKFVEFDDSLVAFSLSLSLSLPFFFFFNLTSDQCLKFHVVCETILKAWIYIYIKPYICTSIHKKKPI